MTARLHDQLRRWAADRPDGEFAVHDGHAVTWRAADERSDRLASALLGLGLPSGSRVAVLAGNSVDYLLLYYAASKAGVVLVPLNPRSAAGEWRHALTDSGAALIVADTSHLAVVNALQPRNSVLATLDGARAPGWLALGDLAASAPSGPPQRVVRDDDDLYQLYTSGTTGLPKGAVLTHRAVTANCAQIAALPHRGFPGERSLVATSLFHAGVVWGVFAPQHWGASIYLQSGFEPHQVVRALAEDGIGYAALVPSMIQMILAAVPDLAPDRFPRLRLIHTGSAPISQATLRAANRAFGRVVMGYGMTEASAGTSAMTPDDTRRGLSEQPALLRSVGRPLTGTEVRIAGRDGALVPAGRVGEALVRGPQLMRGYWRAPVATGETLRGGWLHTGDAGYLDEDGYLYITDRLKDVIISGGVNVYPAHVEEVLHAHPAVAEAAVIGVPHQRWGKTVKAIVVPKPDAAIDAAELLAFCRERLGGPQRPRSLDVVPSLPRTASGKVHKRELRAPYWAGHDLPLGAP